MAELIQFDNNSNLLRFCLKHLTTGDGLTGLSSASTGLIISTIADNEATATIYAVAATNVETITTLGTYAAPTASKCRFKEVDATNHPGLYEFQFADARFSVASSRKLVISVSGATNLLDADYEIALVKFDPYDGVRMGMTALPTALVGGRMDSSVGAMAAGAIDEATFAADTAKYQAKVWLVDDDAGINDRYLTVWFKNGEPVTSGITSPTIQVIKSSDGTDLIASTAMTQIATTGLYKKDEATSRVVDGAGYIAKVQAIIDAATRTWFQPVGRDG